MQNNHNHTRYEAPVLRREGSVRELTFGQAAGGFIDASFPVNTPFNQLTFS